jgi:hypothetical protein
MAPRSRGTTTLMDQAIPKTKRRALNPEGALWLAEAGVKCLGLFAHPQRPSFRTYAVLATAEHRRALRNQLGRYFPKHSTRWNH